MVDRTPQNFARNLRRLIEWADRSIPDLAEEVGLPKSTLHRWCSAGLKQIDRKTELPFAKLTDLLGMPHLQHDNSEMWQETPEWERRMEEQRKLYSLVEFVRCREPALLSDSSDLTERIWAVMDLVDKPHKVLKILREIPEVIRRLRSHDPAMWDFIEAEAKKLDLAPIQVVVATLEETRSIDSAVKELITISGELRHVDSTPTSQELPDEQQREEPLTPIPKSADAPASPPNETTLTLEPLEQVLSNLGKDLQVWYDDQNVEDSISMEELVQMVLQRNGGDVDDAVDQLRKYADSMGFES